MSGVFTLIPTPIVAEVQTEQKRKEEGWRANFPHFPREEYKQAGVRREAKETHA